MQWRIAATPDTPEDVWWEGDSPYSKRVGKNESRDDVLPVLGALRVPEYCDLLTGSTCDLCTDSSSVVLFHLVIVRYCTWRERCERSLERLYRYDGGPCHYSC